LKKREARVRVQSRDRRFSHEPGFPSDTDDHGQPKGASKS
jgi:hypothetical protein